MPDYQAGKIYKICNTIDDFHTGSTTQKLCELISGHRRYSKSNHRVNMPLYQAFAEHCVDNFYIEPIEKYPCNDREELHTKEGDYIR